MLVSGSTARVGITDYAQDALGDVVFVQLPNVGEKFSVGSACCEVESTKSVSDIYVPIEGSISLTNAKLSEAPGLIIQTRTVRGGFSNSHLKVQRQ